MFGVEAKSAAVGFLGLRLAVDGAWTEQPLAPRLPFRTLLQYLKKYVRPQSRTIDRVGWEWVMESVLRSLGYVSDF